MQGLTNKKKHKKKPSAKQMANICFRKQRIIFYWFFKAKYYFLETEAAPEVSTTTVLGLPL